MKSLKIEATILLIILVMSIPITLFSEDKKTVSQSADTTRTPMTDGVIKEGEYRNQIVVAKGKIIFNWFNDTKYMWVGLRAKVKGWAGVGFGPKNLMKDANFIIGYVRNDTTFVSDEYGTGLFSHKSDTLLVNKKDSITSGKNNILEYKGTESEDWTILEFKIPLDSGDKYDKVLKIGKSYKIILAASNKDNFKFKHSIKAKDKISIK